MDVNVYVNGKQVTLEQQREFTVKNEVVSKIVHSAAARYEAMREQHRISSHAGE
ncbi:MAG: hypothetical protein FWH00_02170 [Oscillospiraceae bacterium]|nr:hypothetical protein [Oscillospiraceae bacterium]